jgi:hypothetical protein
MAHCGVDVPPLITASERLIACHLYAPGSAVPRARAEPARQQA